MMIRMEIACFLVLMFIAIMYFSAKREKTEIHKIFSAVIWTSLFNLVFDAATLYTVNHLETVPQWLNNGLHRLFIGTMVLLFYLYYRYIILLIAEETGMKQRFRGLILECILLGGSIFLPIQYIETPNGNYSFGPAAYMIYISVVVYLVCIVIELLLYWKQIHLKKKTVIGIAILIQVCVAVYQAFNPLALLSGMAIMLLDLSFYLTLENPDILLLEQVRKEKQKAEAANQAKSAFLSHMSHEIRTPMNAVVGMTEIMLRGDVTPEQKDYLLNIKRSGNALVSIINDILDLSKIESGKMSLYEEDYELAPLLADLRMMIENRIGAKPIKLIYEIDSRIPNGLYGDELRIRQIVINLLNNAVKFTNRGHIKLVMELISETDEELRIKICVSDTGQGIHKEEIGKLFHAFEQADEEKNKGKEGTGLGLAICSNLIRMMGGELEVRSEYDIGSEFFFTITQGKAHVTEGNMEDEPLKEISFTAPEAKILVVDDNEINLKIAVGLLAPLNMQVDTAAGGREALSKIQKNEYHLIFMDHMMPDIDGVETTKLLRKKEGDYYKNVPVIALTANAMKEAELCFYDAGMNGFLAKPIDVKKLFHQVHKWLPEELQIQHSAESEINPEHTAAEENKIPFVAPASGDMTAQPEGLNVQEGIKNVGSTEFYMELLGDFYLLIDTKSRKIETCVEEGQIRDYTVEVHALKSNARMLGAEKLSREFRRLEQLGQNENIEAIRRETPEVLEHYRSYKEILKPFCMEPEKEIKEVSTNEVLTYLRGIRESIDGFDLDGADAAMKKLEECRMPKECEELMQQLRVFMADVAMEDILRVTEELSDKIQRNTN